MIEVYDIFQFVESSKFLFKLRQIFFVNVEFDCYGVVCIESEMTGSILENFNTDVVI